jgi:hypothetical protein
MKYETKLNISVGIILIYIFIMIIVAIYGLGSIVYEKGMHDGRNYHPVTNLVEVVTWETNK